MCVCVCVWVSASAASVGADVSVMQFGFPVSAAQQGRKVQRGEIGWGENDYLQYRCLLIAIHMRLLRTLVL